MEYDKKTESHEEYWNVVETAAMNREQYQEIWVRTDDEQAMCALINGKMGWLMYLPNDEGDSFHSRNPHYTGDESAVMEFYLSNGQRDEYPLSWVLPADILYLALEYFEREKKPADFICWEHG